ncbi:hypothetical protein F5Y17DRAFT_474274, partial [Xylariaceae sp. FL0594]
RVIISHHHQSSCKGQAIHLLNGTLLQFSHLANLAMPPMRVSVSAQCATQLLQLALFEDRIREGINQSLDREEPDMDLYMQFCKQLEDLYAIREKMLEIKDKASKDEQEKREAALQADKEALDEMTKALQDLNVSHDESVKTVVPIRETKAEENKKTLDPEPFTPGNTPKAPKQIVDNEDKKTLDPEPHTPGNTPKAPKQTVDNEDAYKKVYKKAASI